MIEMQCDSLIEKFGVSPLIVGVVSDVWMRFVASTGVFQPEWSRQTLRESEHEPPLDDDIGSEPRNSSGKRLVMIWFWKLRKAIPLHCSLAICFLACHLAREAVLPTDIVKWSIEGRIPYFAAYIEIEKRSNGPSLDCPISSALMFRPLQAVSAEKLEATAAVIAESVGLHLPKVNFYAIACRYMNELSIPVEEKILSYVCRVYEWSMPPDLWLSANVRRLPSRVCVMSILIVAIRFRYNLHGFGAWERSLSKSASDFDSDEELVHKLETEYSKIEAPPFEFANDLKSYLEYCTDVVFPRSKWSSSEKNIQKLWDYYMNSVSEDYDEPPLLGIPPAAEFPKEVNSETGRMKTDMEENSFCYIVPRVKVKRPDGYLYYNRKRDEGSFRYVAHADYYIVLRSCAKVAQVDIRIMHIGVLSLERRLGLEEKRIDHFVKQL
ncbi:TATA box-binding protein-associated factor RNA polymerase I subunit B [Linum grandiflorum]